MAFSTKDRVGVFSCVWMAFSTRDRMAFSAKDRLGDFSCVWMAFSTKDRLVVFSRVWMVFSSKDRLAVTFSPRRSHVKAYHWKNKFDDFVQKCFRCGSALIDIAAVFVRHR
ncbi:hypothetical protein Bbelb_099220 [Branchiostoma belcheri]|nr:hypothetical protein Bbelb_099220 [Branchiostoma belcheri]